MPEIEFVSCPSETRSGEPFDVRVRVVGATAGDVVQLRLERLDVDELPGGWLAPAHIGTDGAGPGLFPGVVLTAPGLAQLDCTSSSHVVVSAGRPVEVLPAVADATFEIIDQSVVEDADMKTILIAVAAAAAGCEGLETIDPADVTVTECPPELGACSRVADGTSLIPLQVKVVAPSPHADLTATLRLSSGTFVGPSDPSKPTETQLAMAGSEVASATMIAPRRAGVVRVDATVGGITVPRTFPLAPADVADVQIVPTPDRLGDAMPIALQVTAWAQGGKLSNDTVATVELLDAMPADAYHQVFPSRALLDDNGELEVTLRKDAALTSVTVRVTVAPPVLEGVPEAMSKTATLTLTARPPDPERQ